MFLKEENTKNVDIKRKKNDSENNCNVLLELL